MPTLSAQALHNPQLWYTSTPPDQEKDKNARVLAGVRKRALEGAPRLAWLEYAADASHLAGLGDAEAERELIRMRRDPAVLAQANPGLGIRLSLEFTETERAFSDFEAYVQFIKAQPGVDFVTPISLMLQLGELEGQVMGVYLNSVIPEVPEFDDDENRLQWRFRASRAQGTVDNEIAVACPPAQHRTRASRHAR
jgi:hypothetical protein